MSYVTYEHFLTRCNNRTLANCFSSSTEAIQKYRIRLKFNARDNRQNVKRAMFTAAGGGNNAPCDNHGLQAPLSQRRLADEVQSVHSGASLNMASSLYHQRFPYVPLPAISSSTPFVSEQCLFVPVITSKYYIQRKIFEQHNFVCSYSASETPMISS